MFALAFLLSVESSSGEASSGLNWLRQRLGKSTAVLLMSTSNESEVKEEKAKMRLFAHECRSNETESEPGALSAGSRLYH